MPKPLAEVCKLVKGSILTAQSCILSELHVIQVWQSFELVPDKSK